MALDSVFVCRRLAKNLQALGHALAIGMMPQFAGMGRRWRITRRSTLVARRPVTKNDLMATILASLAAALVALWGVAHAIPTSQVLAGFKPVTQDNRRVVLQEWLAEAFTMWGLAGIVVAVTIVGGADHTPASGSTAWSLRSSLPWPY